MAAHLPGARSVDEFWDNLLNGVESVRFYSDEELLAEGVPRELLRHPRYVKAGAPLPDMELFDADFFGFSPKEAAILDPQHRHFLEVGWEALEDAGHPPETVEGPIGVYGGCGMGSYFYFNICSNPDLVDSVGMFLLRHTGNDKDFLCTRASHVFDLTGPSVNVQTACSTSLVAVHYAAQALLGQECDMALAGGVTIEIPHRHGYLYKEGEVLSPDGHCHAFDHRGQGTVFGSGAGVVVLRRLEDAIADGDHIYAVLKSTAINNDGASKAGYLAPSVQGQASCVVEAHALADLDADRVGYVECHGTGTYLGDPIEVSALTEAFRQTTDEKGFCRIGSVKTNIGHLDTAAGVASLIKASLVVKEGTIPASLGFEKPNPTIDFETSPFQVNDQKSDWAGPTPRVAGVNSLGVGGTNAHVLVMEPPARKASGPSKRPFQPIVFSAKSKKALDGYGKKLAAHLRAHPEQPLGDVAWTLLKGRRAFEQRRVIAAATHEEAAALLEKNDPRQVATHAPVGDEPKLVFMFPGGGAQYAGMAKELYGSEPVFRRKVDEGLAILCARLPEDAGYDPKALLFADGIDREEADRKLLQPSVQLPLTLIVEVALAALFQSRGLKPDALIGHSMGENAAACVAGVLSYEDAIGLVLLRGQLFDTVEAGGMLSVSLSADAVRPFLGDELDLACHNAPDLSVVSGPQAALDRLATKLEEREVDFQRIDIDIAAHSRLLDPILDDFRAYLESITLKAPQIPIVSNRTGGWLEAKDATDPDYWVRHLRNAILFAEGVELLAAEPERVYLECGPGRALSSLAKLASGVQPGQVLGALRHPADPTDDRAYDTALMARLWACGLDVDPMATFFEGEERQRVRLPTYAFQRQHYFIEPGEARGPGASEPDRLEDVADFGWQPAWQPRAVPPKDGEPASWLVFMDDAGLGQRLVRDLRAEGAQVTVVYPGDTYAKRSESEYVVAPERGREGYDLLVRDLLKAARVPSRVAHLWLTTGDESFRPGSSFFHRNLERGFYSLFFLMQALADENVPRPLHVNVITNGAAQLGDEGLAYPEKATVLGPVQVIPREFPGVTVSTLDLRLPEPSRKLFGGRLAMALVDPFAGKKAVQKGMDELAAAVLEEVRAGASCEIAALRDGKRYARVFEKRRLGEVEGTPKLVRPGGTYLVTGGLGGLGLVAAQQLARLAGGGEKKPTLLLLSRSGLPERESWDAWVEEHGEADATTRKIFAVREVEALGARVDVVRGDVTNLEQMQGVLAAARERFGPIRGVLHTAGTVNDDLMQMKRQSEVEDVFAPKIHGTQILGELFGRDPECDFLLLYSSTSTAIAPAGQVDYVAANAFLNAYAASRVGGEGPVTIAINWGIWNQVGMAAEAFDTTDLSAGPDELPPATLPLFDGRRRDVHGQLHLFGMHSPKSMWLYDEHRVKEAAAPDARGWALIPGTGYLDVAAQALAELGEEGPFEIQDLFFIRPLQLGDEEEREVRVKLRRTDAGYAMEVRSACVVEGRPAWQLHAQATLALAGVPAAEKVDLEALAARCEKKIDRAPGGIRSPQEEHLSFGPRWRVLKEARYGEGEALGVLELNAAFAKDLEAGWRLHPALMDLATGFAMELIEGYEPTSLWVPVSYESVRVWGPLPRKVRSWVRSAQDNRADGEFALFDVDITDEQGNVLLSARRFAIRKMEGRVSFATAKPPTRADVEFEADRRDGEERQLSPAEQRLRRNLERGIVPSEGAEALTRVLAQAPTEVLVSSLDLPTLIEEAGQTAVEASSSSAKFARPDLDSEYVEPRDDVERTLVGFWEDLLGVDQVGVQDSFFDLGGHSLIAVRLFAMVKKTFEVEFPISVLFEAPTIEACGELIKDAIGFGEGDGAAAKKKKKDEGSKRRFTHVVAMHPTDGGGDRTPFFLVAGMFGNVLNLRHLAHLLGDERPFYGLQARGLYGGDEPHETFEEMAKDYIAEMRIVQPKGPYFVGGFSGGGYTALEIARQLEAEGERVDLLVMLDTPSRLLPEKLSVRDRAQVQIQRFEQKGIAYVAEWAQNRLEWEMGKIRKRFEEPEELSQTEFHDKAIEAAFYRALGRYEIPRWDKRMILFRPPLEKAYVLGPDRFLNRDREFVYPDNGWSRFCDHVEVHEVPGDHDSMVLEPNVRVMASRLRAILEEAEAKGEEGGAVEAGAEMAARAGE
ncbi:MAG: polyketide synthase [Sandaracinus sp.]|nr:polyketide synthase [Myxococcales bacterium]MBJ74481.1 polyketide synthase [Sandaracinus sp.]